MTSSVPFAFSIPLHHNRIVFVFKEIRPERTRPAYESPSNPSPPVAGGSAGVLPRSRRSAPDAVFRNRSHQKKRAFHPPARLSESPDCFNADASVFRPIGGWGFEPRTPQRSACLPSFRDAKPTFSNFGSPLVFPSRQILFLRFFELRLFNPLSTDTRFPLPIP